MITVEDLQHAITQRITALMSHRKVATMTLALADSCHQVLATPITAPFAVPRQNISAMDGYAIATGSQLDVANSLNNPLNKDTSSALEVSGLQVVGESKAGVPFVGSVTVNQAVRIFTGAVVPSGCDTVVMQENVTIINHSDNSDDGDNNHNNANNHNSDNNHRTQNNTIYLTQSARIGDNIRKQGEEIEQDEVVLPAGKRLTPADISLLANLGVDTITVYQPLTIGLLATGDELVELGRPLGSPAHIYNSNTPTLKSMLLDLPVVIQDYGIIADELDATMQAVTQAVQECDVLISTAGVSVGDYDFLTTVIEQLGQINHYKVAMKPGKPFVFGELTQNEHNATHEQTVKTVLYFGLPGNPLSAMVGTLIFIIPALWRLSGVADPYLPLNITVTATLVNDVKKSVGRADYQRGILEQTDDGCYRVSTFASQQSHRVKQMSQANCLLVLPKDSASMRQGELVNVMPLPWM